MFWLAPCDQQMTVVSPIVSQNSKCKCVNDKPWLQLVVAHYSNMGHTTETDT